MCGITGFFDFSPKKNNDDITAEVTRMNECLAHRGPDDSGIWVNACQGIALGHKRLSILDLSQEGAQPMTSACGRYVIAFNGEIYNHRNIRQLLENASIGHKWRGYSDTETMLTAISHWGLEKAVTNFVGMFGFALWDKKEEVLSLARDRMGEKPLYYGWAHNTLLFGSELKALMAHSEWRGEIDRDALALFLKHSYIPSPKSIFLGVFKVLPGTIIRIKRDVLHKYRVLSEPLPPYTYWSARKAAEYGAENYFKGDDKEAIRHLKYLLQDSISQQMLADVPLGAFLSGGIDSSTIVALMQEQSSKPVRTFTVGFDETDFNEAVNAKAIARHLGTNHTELYVTSQDALSVIPKLPSIYDEPFADASQIPTFLVSAMTRKHVTVSLSGDAGDELFGGYARYLFAQNIWERNKFLPLHVRKLIVQSLNAVPTPLLEGLGGLLQQKFRKHGMSGQTNATLQNLFAVWSASSPELLYNYLVSIWKDQESVVLGTTKPITLSGKENWANLPSFLEKMMFFDQVSYLPDDILAKLDRAAMGVSLETRIPLLDHRIVEFIWTLPLQMKVRNGEGKWLLRQVLYNYIPKEMIERPKMGFGMPIKIWLRGPLREWAETLLEEKRIQNEGFFNPRPIRLKWEELLEGKNQFHHYRIWNVLMFQAWFDSYKTKICF